MPANSHFGPGVDALIIGAGHNGLVCAAYLAKAGLEVLVVERSHRIGGACITEELVPGYRFSTFAYGAHGPVPKICRDLEIPAHAFIVVENDPTTFCPFPDGDHILFWADSARSAAGLERFGGRDAAGLLEYQRFMNLGKQIAQEIFLSPPPTHAQLEERFRGTVHAPVLEAMLTRSHWDVLCDHFDNEKVRCSLARADDVGYPTAVGSLLADIIEAASDGAGVEGKSGTVQGGMGAVTAALAAAVRRFGGEIRTSCPVQRVVIENGRAIGVRTEGGELLRARCVISNADPKRTFLKLLAPEDLDAGCRRQVEQLKTRAGYMKYHAILSAVPKFTALPREALGDPRYVANVRIGPSLDYYEQAWRDAQSGIPARAPVMSLQLPTAYTPEMAPPGKHILGAWVRYAPARPRDGDWEQLCPAVTETIVQTIERYAPGFRDLVEWQRLYTPADIERETGITDASIRHLDMTLDQMLHRRPLPGWSAYRAPIHALYLCGSGTHPCGSVTGAPGHNAAQAILQDWKHIP